ncbi:hypothetical protein [Aliivibrio logei]|uniref:hypothetical protein n=1 Tax=Aliivibrio logei TaxID=688 RepID=UPI0035C9293A
MSVRIFILFFGLFFPLFPTILPGTSGLQLIFLALSCMTLALFFNIKKVNKNVAFTFFLLSLLMLIITSISIFFDLVSGVFISSDLFELPRLTFISLTFFVFFAFDTNDKVIFRIVRFFKWTFLIFVLYSFFEVFVSLFKSIAFFLYKREGKEIIGNKAVGSFGITYHFAYFLLIPVFWSFFNFLRERKLINVIVFLICLVALLLTQSRTLFITALIGFFIIPIIPFKYKSSILKGYFVLLVSVVPILFFVFFLYWEAIITAFSYIYSGLSGLIENGVDMSGNGQGSANVRFAQLLWVYNNQFDFPLIGAGIGKGEVVLESVYALYYYRYGLIGICVFAYLITLSVSTTKYLMNNDFEILAPFYFSFMMFYLLSPIALLSSASQDSTRLMLVFYGCLGVFVSRKLLLKSQR